MLMSTSRCASHADAPFRLGQHPSQCRHTAAAKQGAGLSAQAWGWQRQRRRRLRAAAPRCGLDDQAADLDFPRPRKSSQLEPSFWLSREDSLEAQLKALQHNNFPHNDAGIETLYRFTAFDPFARTDYFGVNLDLGQFERYRRIFYTPYFITLLNLSSWEVTSTLEVSERLWVARVHVENAYRREERDYQFYMERRLGGRYDGVWYCSKLLAEGCTARSLYGII